MQGQRPWKIILLISVAEISQGTESCAIKQQSGHKENHMAYWQIDSADDDDNKACCIIFIRLWDTRGFGGV